jgi:Family of unknown function (DUF6502)
VLACTPQVDLQQDEHVQDARTLVCPPLEQRAITMTARISGTKTQIDRLRAEALLFPIAAFLHAGGWTKKNAAKSFSRAFDSSIDKQGTRQLKHIGNPAPYADIVALWIRSRRFIDRSGQPRPLPLQGRASFTSLVREASPRIDPQVALSVLTHFKNVRRTSGGKYKLISPFFLTCSTKSLAFEPMAYFLSDASDTLGTILKRKEQSASADIFWRKAENLNLSKVATKQFLAFSKERTLAFVNEIDEWLEAHQRRHIGRSRGRKYRRVGLGVFSICSSPEPLRPKSSAGR